MSDDIKKQQYKLLAKILVLVGIVFTVSGVYSVLSPDLLAQVLNMDLSTAKIVGGALVFAGLTDFVLGQFFRRKAE